MLLIRISNVAFRGEVVEKEMKKLRRELSQKSVEIETVIGVGSPVEQVNECVRLRAADLIVTSTYGRTDLRRMFIRSTAEKIVRQAIARSSWCRIERHTRRRGRIVRKNSSE
jgi:nucleotide-binding universal stress UspA family protein